jgi:hypothetical protein
MAAENIERLTVVWDANFQKFEEKLNKVVGLAQKGSKDIAGHFNNLDRTLAAPNFGRSLEKIFDSSRLATLDAAGAKLRIFGSALEPLGALGLVAAGGVVALAAALKQAGDAAEFARNIANTAKALHLTTDALQELQFANKAAGGTEEGLTTSLQEFTVALGKAEAGTKRGLVPFKELFGNDFTRDAAKGLGGVDAALRQVIERIGKLRTPEQKDAIIEQLGLRGIAPLVNDGVEKMQALREEAQRIGVVMDEGLIKKGAAANEQFETLSKVIDVQLKSAFVDLAPVLTQLLTIAAKFAHEINDVAQALAGIQHRSRDQLQASINSTDEFIARQSRNLDNPSGEIRGFATAAVKRAFAEREKLTAQLEKLPQDAAAPDVPTGTTDLHPPAGHATNKAAEQIRRFNAELARVALELLAVFDDELHSTQERQQIARDRLVAEKDAKDQAIEDQVQTKSITAAQGQILLGKNAELYAAKTREQVALQQVELDQATLRVAQELNDSVVSILKAQSDLATTAEARGRLEAEILARDRAVARRALEVELETEKNLTEQERQARLNAFDEETRLKKLKQANETADAIAAEINDRAQAQLGNQVDLLQALSQLAETAKERRDIELRILKLQQDEEKARLEAIVASKTATEAEKQQARDRLTALPGIQAGQTAGVIASTRGPLESFVAQHDLKHTVEDFEAAGVKAFDSLADSLASAIVNAKSLGDVAKNVFRTLIQDLLAATIKQAEASILSVLIPGFAGGTDSAPGGVALVGERGPELAFVPRGSQIITADQTRAILSGKGGMGHTTVALHMIVDVSGANGNAEIERIARTAAAQGASQAYKQALRDQPARAAQFDALGR